MPLHHWQHLASPAFAGLDAEATPVILPLAATEQHGPHLPCGTDALIAEGVLELVAERLPAGLTALALPVAAVGASAEHGRFPGTLSVPAAQLAGLILDMASGVAAAGLRKLVIVSSHGGNVAAMTSAALECRIRHSLLAVVTTFARLGLPSGLVEAGETELDIHAGFEETALMLHFRPDLVDMDKAADFPSLQRDLAKRYKHLRAHGPVGFGWLAGDLNAQGAVGNAAAATAKAGAAIARHRADAFIALLDEVAEARLEDILRQP